MIHFGLFRLIIRTIGYSIRGSIATPDIGMRKVNRKQTVSVLATVPEPRVAAQEPRELTLPFTLGVSPCMTIDDNYHSR